MAYERKERGSRNTKRAAELTATMAELNKRGAVAIEDNASFRAGLWSLAGPGTLASYFDHDLKKLIVVKKETVRAKMLNGAGVKKVAKKA